MTIFFWNFMILDSSVIEYAQMLLFMMGFSVYFKISKKFRYFLRFRHQLVYYVIRKRSHQCCEKKVLSEKTFFKVLFE